MGPASGQVPQPIDDPAYDGKLRYVVLVSALLSLAGACVIIFSALRFRELAKRFFAIRLIFFLALTDSMAAAFNVAGALLAAPTSPQTSLHAAAAPPPDGGLGGLCEVQAVGLLYFNLASILWTTCFAFTLYRDVVPTYRRHALRNYELYFHALCWPLPALLAGGAVYLRAPHEPHEWCSLGLAYSRAYLPCFYVPLFAAFAFNALTYTAVLANTRERRVSRITSLYLLSFAAVWLPSLLSRVQVALSASGRPAFALAALEAVCMPLQGALNACVYGWSLPSLRDLYRTMLLGADGLDGDGGAGAGFGGGQERGGRGRYDRSPSYSPPEHPDAALPYVAAGAPPPQPLQIAGAAGAAAPHSELGSSCSSSCSWGATEGRLVRSSQSEGGLAGSIGRY